MTQRVTRDPLEFHLLSHSPETELNTEGREGRIIEVGYIFAEREVLQSERMYVIVGHEDLEDVLDSVVGAEFPRLTCDEATTLSAAQNCVF